MTTPPTDYPCTGEPAVPAVAQVVEVLTQSTDVMWLEVRNKQISVVDFYAKG